VPGRFEVINGNSPFTVIVDFAHTDDSLKRTIAACRELAPKRIITVFGCGGDRDRGKRPLMGKVAATASDYAIITSDNPRSEDPEKITLDVETGIKTINRDNYEVIVDREKAIEKAINMASRGDIVLIAGKGHEEYQITGSGKEHFSDRETVIKYLERIKKNGKNGNH
jgi:UDP-N-acetylmuramoyl-L-alanyl-D-glutamate--2,6-diaminopimelate ligase